MQTEDKRATLADVAKRTAITLDDARRILDVIVDRMRAEKVVHVPGVGYFRTRRTEARTFETPLAADGVARIPAGLSPVFAPSYKGDGVVIELADLAPALGTTEEILARFAEAIETELRLRGEVHLTGFGILRRGKVPGHEAETPIARRTGRVKVLDYETIYFKRSRTLRERLRGGDRG